MDREIDAVDLSDDQLSSPVTSIIKGKGASSTVYVYNASEYKEPTVIRIQNPSYVPENKTQARLNDHFKTCVFNSGSTSDEPPPYRIIDGWPHTLFGDQYVPPQKHILLTAKEAALYGASFAAAATLMPDVTFLPTTTPSDYTCTSPQVCIEIKPKCGILPYPSHYPDDSIEYRLRSSTPQFTLHQLIKLEEGKIEKLSEYNPIDLFSGVEKAMLKALKSLLQCPQNNLIVFLDGQRVTGATPDTSKSGSERTSSVYETIAHALGLLHHTGQQSDQGTSVNDSTNAIDCIASVLQCILSNESVLENIASVQKIGAERDIVQVYSAYKRFVAREGSIIGEPRNNHGLYCDGQEESTIHIIRDHLVAATAKDCSIMITMRRRDDINVNPACLGITKRLVQRRQRSRSSENSRMGNDECQDCTGMIVMSRESSGHPVTPIVPIEYYISVVDIELKALHKIEHHYELDLKLTDVAKRLWPHRSTNL